MTVELAAEPSSAQAVRVILAPLDRLPFPAASPKQITVNPNRTPGAYQPCKPNDLSIAMMGLDNPVHLAFLFVLLLLVFGAKRLPELGRSVGAGLRGFGVD